MLVLLCIGVDAWCCFMEFVLEGRVLLFALWGCVFSDEVGMPLGCSEDVLRPYGFTKLR